MSKKLKIALLIDTENINATLVDEVIKNLKIKGDIFIKRAYRDWKQEHKKWEEKCEDFNIQPIWCKKNGAKDVIDFHIALDAMILALEKNIDIIAVMSSDGDFVTLATKIKEKGVQIFAYGDIKTPAYYQKEVNYFYKLNEENLCKEFIYILESIIDNTIYLGTLGKELHEIDSTLKKRCYKNGLKKAIEQYKTHFTIDEKNIIKKVKSA